MPDITPAQIVALVKALIGVGAAFGLSLNGDQTQAILVLVGLLAPSIALFASDAVIRHGRSRVLANPESLAQIDRPQKPVTF